MQYCLLISLFISNLFEYIQNFAEHVESICKDKAPSSRFPVMDIACGYHSYLFTLVNLEKVKKVCILMCLMVHTSNPKQLAVKKEFAPQNDYGEKDVKSKVAAKKWL